MYFTSTCRSPLVMQEWFLGVVSCWCLLHWVFCSCLWPCDTPWHAVPLSSVSHRDLGVVLTGPQISRVPVNHVCGRRSVRMFALRGDPALRDGDVSPPVVTHGRGRMYQTLRTRPCYYCVFIDGVLNDGVLWAEVDVAAAALEMMIQSRDGYWKWSMTSWHLILPLWILVFG